MRIRTQVIVAIAVSFTVLASLLLTVNGVLAAQRFHQLEDTKAADQVDRLRSILDHEAVDLGGKLSDWSVWDDNWKYLNGTNPEFITTQITSSTLSGNGCDLMLFLDRHGKVRHREVTPGDGGGARSAALGELIANTPALRPLNDSPDSVVSGLLSLEHGLVRYAARPVLHSDGSGPARFSPLCSHPPVITSWMRAGCQLSPACGSGSGTWPQRFSPWNRRRGSPPSARSSPLCVRG